MWGFLCAVAFPQQILQINAVISDNNSLKMSGSAPTRTDTHGVCGMRDSSIASPEVKKLHTQSLGTKKYMKSIRFEQAFLWFMASLQKHVAFSMFSDIQANLLRPEPSSRALLQPVKSDGTFKMGSFDVFSGTFDFAHPYWLNRRFLFVANETFAGYLSACGFLADVRSTNKVFRREWCESTPDTNSNFASPFEADMLVLLINHNQMLLEQNQAILRRIDALEKHHMQ